VPGFTKDMVVMLQGFIVLFSGALAYVFTPLIAKLYFRIKAGSPAAQGAA
jgi:general nucleoside transport system permease protein